MNKIGALLAGCLCCAIPLFATSVYMTDSTNEFGTLDLITGVFTPINTTPATIYGMSFGPNGTLYATDDKAPSNVYTINRATGTATNLGASNGYTAYGSAVGSNGLIYAVSEHPSDSAFYTINPSTLATNTINASLGFPSDGLAVFDNGQFYTDDDTGTGSDTLEQIDPTTGAVTQIGSGLGFETFGGALVDGTFYTIGVLVSGPPVLETVDPTTGTATFVTDITGMSPGATPDAIAYNTPSPAPEPCTQFLAGLGALLFAAIWLRAKRTNPT